MHRAGIMLLVAGLLTGGCSEQETEGEEPSAAGAVEEQVAAGEPAEGAEGEAAEQGAEAQAAQAEDEPLWLKLRGSGDEPIPIRAVVLDRAEASGRVLFFRDEVTCEGIPRSEAEKRADETLVVAASVDPIPPGLVGTLHPTEWAWKRTPQEVRTDDEWEIELEGPEGESGARGRAHIVTSEQGDYAFELDGDFSAIVCTPETD